MAKQTKERRFSRKQKTQAPPQTFKERAIELAKSIGFALAAVIVLNSFVLASFQVPTGSMEQTVMAGDLLFVNKFIYGGMTPPTIPILGIITGTEVETPYFRVPGFRDPEKGDVIVFIFPGNRDEVKSAQFQYYLKRCVATSGDTLQVINKQVFINGKPVDNPEGLNYIYNAQPPEMVNPQIFPPGKPWNQDNYGPLVIPAEGDNIAISMDNIHEWITFIRREGHEVRITGTDIQIDGKTVTSYTVERDYVFGMGDNRDDSLDSRFWGFVPKEHVVGTPMIVYWSWDPNTPLFQLFKKIGSVRWSRIFTLID